jgi:hypothetical protein
VLLQNSILCPNAPGDTNVFGPLVDAGYNIDSGKHNSLTNSTSLNDVNPALAPLGNYGGPTPTMALLPGSPAIDAGDPNAFPATDQRGRPRPYGPAPDIGAFEYTPSITISGQVAGLLPTEQASITATYFATFTSNGGAYSFQMDEGPPVTVSPSNANYIFVPPAQTISPLANQTGVNFQAYRFNAITLTSSPTVPVLPTLGLGLAGNLGQQFRLQTSADLASWAVIATNTIGAAGYEVISLPLPSSGSRFFRLVSP